MSGDGGEGRKMIRRRLGMRRTRSASIVLALVAAAAFAGSASAQSANPFAFLFGGSPREGRSAYAPAPSYVPGPGGYAPAPSYGYRPHSYGYSALPGYSDPYGDEQPGEHRPGEFEGLPHGPSPKEVMAAIKAVKPGKGPLGPFLNDPTLRAGSLRKGPSGPLPGFTALIAAITSFGEGPCGSPSNSPGRCSPGCSSP